MNRFVDAARWHLDGERMRHRLGFVRCMLPNGGVCLSFDDGPDPKWTPVLLDELARLQVRATFFCVGRRALDHPEIVRRMLSDGHTVGSHSDEHAHPRTQSLRAMRRSFERGRQQVESVTGAPVWLFRPPTGLVTWRSAAMSRRAGLRTWLWSVDPEDWRDGITSAEIARRCSAAQSGDIVLLHDAAELPESEAARDRSATVNAVPKIVRAVRDNGLDFVPISPEFDRA
ncbi:MAG: polysaccharide deacetylase family protein [Acidimicrobiales bacterium]